MLYHQASNYFEIPAKDSAIAILADDEKTNNFLDDGNTLVLTMNLESRKDGDIRIHLNNLPSPGQQDDKVIIFYKKKPDVITPENMQCSFKSIKEGAKLSLLHLFEVVNMLISIRQTSWSVLPDLEPSKIHNLDPQGPNYSDQNFQPKQSYYQNLL